MDRLTPALRDVLVKHIRDMCNTEWDVHESTEVQGLLSRKPSARAAAALSFLMLLMRFSRRSVWDVFEASGFLGLGRGKGAWRGVKRSCFLGGSGGGGRQGL